MKYQIRASINVDGIVERKDIIGAIMGQTEGLVGEELELRKLQRTARIGHVDVEIEAAGGRLKGHIIIPSSLDSVETAIIASQLETIDRIGPCKSIIKTEEIRDVRSTKRTEIVERAKELLLELVSSESKTSRNVVEEVRSVLTTGKATAFHGLTAGPNVESSDSLILVEGRNDVLNLLNFGIKNAISCDGAGTLKPELIELANKKGTVIAAIDGDRGGEMLLKQLAQVITVHFVAQAPVGQEWELLPQKTVTKCLSSKEPADKVLRRLKTKEQKDDAEHSKRAGVMPDVPDEVQPMFDVLTELAKNKTVFIYMQGDASEPIGPKDVSKEAEGADGAVAMVHNGPINDKMIEIAAANAIDTVIGTKAGKGYAEREDVTVHLMETYGR